MDCHSDHTSHHEQMIADFKRRFFVSLVLALPVVLLSSTVQSLLSYSFTFAGDQFVSLALATVVFLYGGWPFLKGTYDELAGKNPGMMTLIGVAITVAFVYSTAVVLWLSGTPFLWELVTLIVIMLAGHWIEIRSIMGASRALEALSKLMPETAHRLQESGEVEDVVIAELTAGDRVLVRPGERVPADGTVVDGESAVDQHMLTGESQPVAKERGDEVIAGAVNGNGSLTIAVEQVGEESYLSQVTQLVEQAQASRSHTQRLADRAARWLTAIALAAGTITFLVWYALLHTDIAYALERSIAAVIVACPHALGLAIPLVVSFSTAMAARSGVLIRNRTAFERARDIDTVLFDKTGTLTTGAFQVTETVAFADERTPEGILSLAAAVEQHSEHPIAAGIRAAVSQVPQAAQFEAIPGTGAAALVDGTRIAVVSGGYLEQHGIAVSERAMQPLRERGATVVYVLAEEEPIGAIGLQDTVRDEARDAVAQLHERGISVAMITGDSEAVAVRVANELAIDSYQAAVLPDEKEQHVASLQEEGRTVAMVGDGVNDAPALARADIGVAIGAGTDVALESADIVLVNDDPGDVVTLLMLARRTYRKMVQNLWWAAGYNIVAVPLAAGVLAGIGIVLSPALGAVLMSASTVIVAFNASLLRSSADRTT
jgi:Cu2+-exporting ATPase